MSSMTTANNNKDGTTVVATATAATATATSKTSSQTDFDISMQLRQIQDFQTKLLQQKQDELQQLHLLLKSQQEQLQLQQEEIRQIQIDRLREQDQRAAELQQLVRNSNNAAASENNGGGGGAGGYRNPYNNNSSDSDEFIDCSDLFLICSTGGGGDDSHSSLRRRRVGRGRRGSSGLQQSSSYSYRKTDILHGCFVALFVLLQLRYFIHSSRSVQHALPSNENVVPSYNYNNDYSSYNTPPEPPKLKPWESKPPTPIELLTSSSTDALTENDNNIAHYVKQRHLCLAGIRERHETELGTFLFGNNKKSESDGEEVWRTLLVDPAYHTNVGDHMLTLGELTFLNKHNNAKKNAKKTEQCHHMQSEHFYPECDSVMLERKNSDSIEKNNDHHHQWALWHAGGNWGDLWWDVHGLRMKSFERYLQNDFNIVSMPQSMFYQDVGLQERDAIRIKESIALGLGLAEREKEEGYDYNTYGGGGGGYYGRRRLDDWGFEPEPKPVNTSKLDTFAGLELAKSRVTFTWRERESYDKAVQLYPYVNHMVIPDIAFQLGPFQPIRKHKDKLVDILFLLRGDHESMVQTYRDENYLRTLLPSPQTTTFRVVDWPDRLQIFDTRDSFFTDTSIELLSLGKIVICDRLHAAILCYLSGLPFVYIDQISGKISNTFRVAFEQMEDCANGEATSLWAKATSMEEAVAKATALVQQHKLDHNTGVVSAGGGGLRGIFGY